MAKRKVDTTAADLIGDDDEQEPAGVGHNSGGTAFAQGQLQSLVERIERLEEEKKSIATDIKEVYAEAKANGFDTKALRKVVALRKKDQAEREEEEAMVHLYLHALGMLPDFEQDEEAALA